ncbi:MAG: Chromate resistance protein ChrB [Pseudomonadota bacterium]|nr:Chromate resistance protein ChrB [Pseudomonadota bacterium]MEE3101341.1 Chromate resistance protein ChrB [Pseudomonadota bacterium]
MTEIAWLLTTYKIPPEPAARRMAVWRKLKGMGAVYLQGGVCLLPRTPDHVRRLKMLEKDVADAGGECVILETVALDPAQEAKVMARFRADRDDVYGEFISKCGCFEAEIAREIATAHFTYAELEEEDADLRKLQGWFAKIQALDFYGAPRAAEAAERLAACEAALDDYARRVFDRHDENR